MSLYFVTNSSLSLLTSFTVGLSIFYSDEDEIGVGEEEVTIFSPVQASLTRVACELSSSTVTSFSHQVIVTMSKFLPFQHC